MRYLFEGETYNDLCSVNVHIVTLHNIVNKEVYTFFSGGVDTISPNSLT